MGSLGIDWNLDCFRLNEDTRGTPLTVSGQYALQVYNLYDHLQIPKEKAGVFFDKLESLYKDNYYHNAIHAVDVLNSYLFFVNQSYLREEMSGTEILVGVIGNLAHDVAHPSLTNRYLINSNHDIAVQYNDFSVLEMMHASMTFQLLK